MFIDPKSIKEMLYMLARKKKSSDLAGNVKQH